MPPPTVQVTAEIFFAERKNLRSNEKLGRTKLSDEVEFERNAYDEVFLYLCDDSYPCGFTKDQKRDLRKKAQKFVLENGALFYVGQGNNQPRRWVHNVDEQWKILTACHTDKLAGHFSRDRYHQQNFTLKELR